MSIINFDEIEVPDTLPPLTDETPVDEESRECAEPGCDTHIVKRGKFWPKYCAEHAPGALRGRAKQRKEASDRKPPANPAKAKQAAAVLGQINDLIVLGLTAVTAIPALPISLPNTASALASANEDFLAQAEEALATDPKLCDSILRVGQAGGKAALFTAYLTLGVSLAPAIVVDVKASRTDTKDE